MSEATADPLRTLVVRAAVVFAILSPVVGLAAGLAMYGDGSIFAYSIAARDAWDFHWHNISGRVFGYLVLYLPADAVVAWTGSARAGIAAYGALLFAMPAASLGLTYALDATARRIVFSFACASAVCLLPFCYGFPTEMATAHALFWPTLALALDARGGSGRAFGLYALFQSLVLTHEGGVILAACAALASLATAPRRGFGAFAAALFVWAVVKGMLPPDAHIAGVLGAAAYKFIDLANLTDPAVRLAAAVLAGFAFLNRLMGRPKPAAFFVAGMAVLWWLFFDDALLAEKRYSLRTFLLIATPLFGLFATLLAADAATLARLPMGGIAANLRARAAQLDTSVLGSALALLLLVHTVETSKFVVGWIEYKSAIRALATGPAADPELGDAHFVSAARIAPDIQRLAWNSTTPYLSILLAPGFAPTRLVVDPKAGYFWLSCETATRNAAAESPLSPASRELIRTHACLNR